jgi:AraC-like DNA-binding protein
MAVMGAILSTRNVPQADCLTYWNEYVCSAFVKCEIDSLTSRPYRGTIHYEELDPIRLADVTSSRSLVRRSKGAISTLTDAWVKILYQVSGESTLVQDGRTAHTLAGQWMIGDCTRPYDLWIDTDDCRHLVVYVPQRHLLARLTNLPMLTAQTFASDRGLGRVAYDFAWSLLRQAPHLNADAAPGLADTLLDLITTDLHETLEPSEVSQRNGPITALSIKAFIRKHLADPHLSVDTIAAAMHLSKGYIHMLFRMEDTTISRYIWDLRLEMCRKELANPQYEYRSVSDIAYAWGFNSLSHFSHSFKSRYGYSPRAYRYEQATV